MPTPCPPDALQAGLVGLIGLGLVGVGLAQRLQAAGYRCIGHDVRAQACADFASQGHAVADSVPALADQARTLVLAVFDTRGVVEIAQALMAKGEAVRGLTLVDCSTGDPQALEALAASLHGHGIDFIEAPLSGSSAQIAAGEATMLLGGATQAIEAQNALLQALSPRRIHVGGAGIGARAKLATNLVLGLNRAVFAEGLVFAERLGIAPAQFLELVLATPARSEAAALKGPMMVSGQFAPQSRIRQHLKDVQLMLDAAQAAGQGLPLSAAHAALMRAAIAAGDGDLDNAAIVQQIRRETPRG